jgi:carbamate kinase
MDYSRELRPVYLNYGQPDETPLSVMTVDEAQKYLNQEHFPPGSMGPKIEAAVEYVRSGGKEVLITSANHLKASLINRSGTKIIAAQ